MKYIISGIQSIYIPQFNSLYFPANTLVSIYDMIPILIPLGILDVNVVNIIVAKAGNDSVKSLKSISLTPVIINNPIRINAGAVASLGIIAAIGVINSVNAKQIPVVTAVSPVLPPSSTPAADSINVVIVVEPNNAPIVVANASTKNGLFISGKSPFSSNKSAFADTPIKVPNVEKKSPTKNVKISGKKLHLKADIISNLNAIDSIEGGIVIKLCR